jgi:hypothetical protein
LIFFVLAALFCSLVRSHTYVCSLSHSQNASPSRKISARSTNMDTLLDKTCCTRTFCFPIACNRKELYVL